MKYILKEKNKDDRFLRGIENDLIYNTPYPNIAMRFNNEKFANELIFEYNLENYIAIPLDEV